MAAWFAAIVVRVSPAIVSFVLIEAEGEREGV